MADRLINSRRTMKGLGTNAINNINTIAAELMAADNDCSGLEGGRVKMKTL